MDKSFNQEEIEKIEAYLLGQMEVQERNAFEFRLRNEPGLAKELDLMSSIIMSVEAKEVKATIAKVVKQPISSHQATIQNHIIKGQEKKSPLFVLKYLLPIAAILIGAIVYFNFFDQKEDVSLFATYYTTDPGLPTAMGSSAKAQFYSGMVDYKMKNFDQALNIWEPLIQKNPNNDTLQFYTAMALLENDQIEASANLLSKIIPMEESSFWNKSVWYHALISLKQGDASGAQTLLKLIKDKDWLLKKEVATLYEELTKE